jgi:hypothetical protein
VYQTELLQLEIDQVKSLVLVDRDRLIILPVPYPKLGCWGLCK